MNGSSTTTEIADLNNRFTHNMWWRVRGYITADARNQSEYGTIRSYIAVGINTNEVTDENQTFNANKAFIQFAGFTFGRATSFFDFYAGAATSYFGFYPQSDTGDGGQNVMAYTAQFGNGLSASLSAESRRMTQIINANTSTTTAGAAGGNQGAGGFSTAGSTNSGAGAYGGWQVPDIVGNLRVDQAWGSAQIMGALHQVNATYYTGGLENSGHPADAWGFAVGAGAKIMLPMISPGDYIWGQINYTQGALRYLFQNPNGNHWLQHGTNVTYGVLSDGVYGGTLGAGTTTSVQLTTAWGFNLAYEHIWNKQWKTSAHGGWYEVKYNSSANAMLCSAQTAISPLAGAGAGTAALATAGCNNNWSLWWIGSRTQFNIDASTYLGLDVAYTSIRNMTMPSGTLTAGNTSTASYPLALSTQGNWEGRFRVHRDFYP
jgi:hypothetical protein